MRTQSWLYFMAGLLVAVAVPALSQSSDVIEYVTRGEVEHMLTQYDQARVSPLRNALGIAASSQRSSERAVVVSPGRVGSKTVDRCPTMLCPHNHTCKDSTCIPLVPKAPSCSPLRCADGSVHPTCTPEGYPIDYFANPCQFSHASSSTPSTFTPVLPSIIRNRRL